MLWAATTTLQLATRREKPLSRKLNIEVWAEFSDSENLVLYFNILVLYYILWW